MSLIFFQVLGLNGAGLFHLLSLSVLASFIVVSNPNKNNQQTNKCHLGELAVF
jgi:hypothetical protein